VYPIDVNTITSFHNGTNFSYSISGGIYDSVFYRNYAELYQEFKLEYTYLYIVPVQYQGTQPPVAYSMCLVNELMSVNFSEMPYLQGVTKIFGRGITQIIYKGKGRTSDFNRWYNTKDEFNLNLILKLHSSEAIGEKGLSPYYKVICRSRVLFRRPIIQPNNREVEDINIVYNEPQFKNSEKENKEEVKIEDKLCKDACSEVNMSEFLSP
jgi:hypothetical protein